jgi:hypothetical protein
MLSNPFTLIPWINIKNPYPNANLTCPTQQAVPGFWTSWYKIQTLKYATSPHPYTSHQTSEYNRMGLVLQGLYIYLLDTCLQWPDATCKKPYNSQNWDVKFVGAAITLYKDIWDARNKHIHGQTKKWSITSQHQKVQEQVINIYRHPPSLTSHYQPIRKVPLSVRLQSSTKHLKQWMYRVKDQVEVSNLIKVRDKERQRSILQYVWDWNDDMIQKYPP